MGFLNHSTNNIIIDAVLTEKGREFLSRNDNSFNITQFRFGDDEIDYSILEKYGLIIGKEKIEKNTPIFEALTDENLALKYPLRTFVSNNTRNIFAFPFLKESEDMITPIFITSNSTDNNSVQNSLPRSAIIRVKTFLNQDTDFTLTEGGLIDTSFTVKMFDKVLKISNREPLPVIDDIGYYNLTSTGNGSEFQNQKLLEFEITAIGRTTLSTYNFFSSSSDPAVINTQIQIIGNNTNSTIIIPVKITSNNTSS